MVPARGAIRLPCAGLLVAAVVWVGQAAAQDKPRPRPKPLPEPSDAPAAPTNSLSDAPSAGAPGIGASGAAKQTPGDPTAKPPVLRPVLPPPAPLVLRSAVHSRYSRPPTLARSTTGQCRAQCAVTRTQCASGETETSGCDPGWTQCLSTCAGLTYSRGP